jgi:hypothetical protein
MQPVSLAARVHVLVPFVHSDVRAGPQRSVRQAEAADARADHRDLHRAPPAGRFMASSDRRTPSPVRRPFMTS